ncbi:MAG: hypothetical protein WC004_03235 [Candidatus Absconditabacterales bacterium]
MKKIVIIAFALMGLYMTTAYAVICDMGEYYNPEGEICEDCVTGSYCPGDDQIYACPAGSHMSDIRATSCVACGPGMYAPAGASSCSLCVQGTYEPVGGVATCAACAPGMYANSLGSTQCSPCPANTFSRYAGAPSCAVCRDGTVSGPGATTCIPIGGGVDSYTFAKVPILTGSIVSGTMTNNLKNIVKKKIKRVVRLWRK